eukprot:2261432-Prymnesium_polylepis.1
MTSERTERTSSEERLASGLSVGSKMSPARQLGNDSATRGDQGGPRLAVKPKQVNNMHGSRAGKARTEGGGEVVSLQDRGVG